ncbi:trehalose-phosphatase [Corynebacterium pygosceleis]|uniref:Trehalose 6-phosphate phosphatase n=1 Tax=Corynebacterium pygosceleis TaxID=2800406 RepID=A0A9Q4C909_9CORY|nr:trehalose-phosphatase [Corynebacterium pygosceleis]MCK7638442.1 trehalose-phosphatase [Corynebacterium pygosceleis]MCK7675422.1 trehalose-phosphatase [Corynebacterium pygosceleis]MCL0121184.1 trehalose-phosphatase [Corynebacterium pygosceleis]MCX7445398.1 trehalose-phosphatase [Corynebacterium pygosceleis]MCX7469106.1 trehalose-phosphatase [Corynebacterium pygosceleis]
MDDTSLDSILDSLSRVPRLLVISDFDGTIAELQDDPETVPVNRDSVTALETLGGLPDTGAVILSGRDLATLRRLAGAGAAVDLVGSHGAESTGDTVAPTVEQRRRLDAVTELLEPLVDGCPGAAVEVKPLHRVLHTRRVPDREAGERLLRRAVELCPEGLHVSTGKCIVEFSAVSVDKGTWISGARERGGWDAIVFLGDDVTDENGFGVLGDGDLGIKVGDGPTAAGHRVADTDGVCAVLGRLAEARSAYLDR